MKILHLSDLHFGKSPFKKDITDLHKQLCDIIADTTDKNGIGAVLISGDIYDTSTSTAAAASLWDRLTKQLILGCKVPVCVISGNHDGSERLAVCSDILSGCGLNIRGTLDGFDIPVTVGSCDIYMLPFFEKGHAETYFKKRFASLTEAYEEITEIIRRNMNREHCNIIMAHCFAAGGIPSESETSADVLFAAEGHAAVGAAAAVSPDVFRGFDYAALGHIHKPQNIRCCDENTLIRYCGTPMKYSFSEAEQTKSFTVYDTESHTVECLPIKELIRFRVIKGSYDEICGMASEHEKDEWVRLELTDNSSGVSGGRLRELYPNAMQITADMKNLPAAAKSGISADDAVNMEVSALAAVYLKEFYGCDITEEQKGWLDEAVKSLDEERSEQHDSSQA